MQTFTFTISKIYKTLKITVKQKMQIHTSRADAPPKPTIRRSCRIGSGFKH